MNTSKLFEGLSVKTIPEYVITEKQFYEALRMRSDVIVNILDVNNDTEYTVQISYKSGYEYIVSGGYKRILNILGINVFTYRELLDTKRQLIKLTQSLIIKCEEIEYLKSKITEMERGFLLKMED